MKNNIWVCRHDGLIQCDDNSKETPLADDRKDLAEIIGDQNILAMEKRSMMVVTLCGMPQGGLNAYEITPDAYELLMNGIPGPNGFFLCPCESKSALHQSEKVRGSVTNTPVLIRELIGRPLRAYKTGDALTEDFRPERVNIEHDADGYILDIWFG